MTRHDPECLCLDCTHRRLGRVVRAAQALRSNLEDLHSIGWEPAPPGDGVVVDQGEQAARTDWAPRAGDPRARRLLDHLARVAARADTELAGADHLMKTIFHSHGPIIVGGTKTLVSRAEFDRAARKQQDRRAAGGYTPNRLVDQPQHPGRKR